MSFHRLLTLLMLFLLTAQGCALLPRKPMLAPPTGPVSPAALAMYAELKARNQDIQSLKAIGDIRLETSKGTRVAHIAFTVLRPDKMRMTIMAISGVTVADVATDGATLTMIDHEQGGFYREDMRDRDLARLLDLPIRPAEVIAIVCGVMPPVNPGTMSLTGPDGDHLLQLTLFDESRKPTLQVRYDTGQHRPREIVVFKADGDTAYRASIERETAIDGHTIPVRISFADDSGHSFRLTMDNVWINPGAAEHIFVLQP